MNTKLLNRNFIEAVKEHLPENAQLSGVLMNILGIGKEAVYRRLRCEVPFTFTEASLISQKLGISLDHLSSARADQSALFNLHMINHENPFDTYHRAMEDLLQNYVRVKDDPVAECYTASNLLPHMFYMDHEYLSKFLLYKWMYQQNKAANVKYLDDLEVPAKIRRVQADFVETTRSIASSTFIWDEMMFLSLINELKYFYDIRLITLEEKNILKEELLSMIDTLEDLAFRGAHPNGKKVFIYVSRIHFEATYSYLQAKSFRLSFIRVYSINTISTTDWNLFEYQKNWIQSLKKYSTLITVSGEMPRIQFLEKQRTFVNEL
jgi:hypothetical protein